jgi:hypothetical protein
MCGDLVCCLVDIEAFEIQMRAITFHIVADAEGRGIAHPLVLRLEGSGRLSKAFDLIRPGVGLAPGDQNRIISEQ